MGKKAIDLHCDTVMAMMRGVDITKPTENLHVDLPRLRKGDVGLQVFAVFIPPADGYASMSGKESIDLDGDTPFEYTKKRIDKINAFTASSDLLAGVETAEELKVCLAANKTGIMLAVENGYAIEESLQKLEELRRLKVRLMTLVHSQHLSWIASCTGKEKFIGGAGGDTSRGLGDFGLKVVDAMNDLGIIPDVSHSSESAFWDVIKRSKKPIIATHSCAYSICAAARNLKDDQLKALGESGGLVGVNFFSGFLSEAFRQAREKLAQSGNSASEIQVKVPTSIIADHIDYMVKLAGEDCVGLGSDFDGIPAAPEGVTGCDFFPVLETELQKRGYSEKQIDKIFNKNFIRVLEEWD